MWNLDWSCLVSFGFGFVLMVLFYKGEYCVYYVVVYCNFDAFVWILFRCLCFRVDYCLFGCWWFVVLFDFALYLRWMFVMLLFVFCCCYFYVTVMYVFTCRFLCCDFCLFCFSVCLTLICLLCLVLLGLLVCLFIVLVFLRFGLWYSVNGLMFVLLIIVLLYCYIWVMYSCGLIFNLGLVYDCVVCWFVVLVCLLFIVCWYCIILFTSFSVSLLIVGAIGYVCCCLFN